MTNSCRCQDHGLYSELENALHDIVGSRCWSYAANVNTGSCVSFQIGRKVLREKPLRNPRISKRERLYKGEFGFYVSCSWRLDWKGKVLCGGEDDKSEEGPMMLGLREMLNRRVVSVDIEQPSLDLALVFEGDLVFRIFCDEFEPNEDGLDNYVLFLPDCLFVVGARSTLVKYEDPNPVGLLDFQLVGAPSRGELDAGADLTTLGIWKHPDREDQEICSLIGSHCVGSEVPEEGLPSIQFSFIESGALQTANLTLGCSWRLDSSSRVLCGIGMPPDEKRRGLDQIAGQVIRTIEMSPEMDLRIHFGNGLKLSIFCGHVNEVSMWDNYGIEGPWGSFIVGTCGEVRRE
jgi:hypothetical protein